MTSETPLSAGPSPEHRRLARFVGKWHTEGTIHPDPADPSGATTKAMAVDTYEWLPGGFFLVHHVEGRMGDDEVRAIEIIGYDATSRSYRTYSFDNQGNTATYEAMLRGDEWTIRGESERFTGTFAENGRKLSGRWERSTDGRWWPWMDLTLTKMD